MTTSTNHPSNAPTGGASSTTSTSGAAATTAAPTTGGGSQTTASPTVGHVNHNPYAPTNTDPAWLGWSAAWTTQVRILTGRNDLTVVVAPGAGGGAPACHIPALALIEVDAALIGNDPTIADPRRPGHKKVVPAAYGALVHEAAHAVHSHWAAPGGTPPIVAAVADMLEESRAEHHHRQRRPRDRQWLRHAVNAIVAPNFARTDHPWDAAGAAALLLARVDTRVLSHTDTKPVWTAVRRILGTRTLRSLRNIWKTAHEVHDHDGPRMLMLAEAWCRALGIDPTLQPQLPDLTGQPAGRHLPQAVGAALAAIDPTPQPNPHQPPPASRQQTGGRPNPGGHGDKPASWTTRPPTPGERRAAAALATALRRARTREPAPVRQASMAPPGRLQARQAITAQAQQASGAVISAQPWQRTVRRQTPDPELAAAVLVDVSGSMRRFTAPLSAAAWILANATARAGAVRAVTIAFGDRVTVLAPPGRPPALVQQMAADSATHQFTEAVELANQHVGLTTRGVVRLLVVVSDGVFGEPGNHAAQHAITGLHQAGCAVLWLQPASAHTVTYQHTTTLTVTNPAASIRLISDAATNALAAA